MEISVGRCLYESRKFEAVACNRIEDVGIVSTDAEIGKLPKTLPRFFASLLPVERNIGAESGRIAVILASVDGDDPATRKAHAIVGGLSEDGGG